MFDVIKKNLFRKNIILAFQNLCAPFAIYLQSLI